MMRKRSDGRRIGIAIAHATRIDTAIAPATRSDHHDENVLHRENPITTALAEAANARKRRTMNERSAIVRPTQIVANHVVAYLDQRHRSQLHQVL
jgi:ABC-type antimicrobial peptide transport system ATPase subunit